MRTEHSSTPESCFTFLSESLPTEQLQFKGSAALLPGQHSYIQEHCSAWALLHEQRQDPPCANSFWNDNVALAPWAQSDPPTAHPCQANTGSTTRKIASAHTNLPDRDQIPYQTWLDTANICSRHGLKVTALKGKATSWALLSLWSFWMFISKQSKAEAVVAALKGQKQKHRRRWGMKYTHSTPKPPEIKGLLAVLTLLWVPVTGYLKTNHAAYIRPKMSECIWPGITRPYVQPNH